MSTHAGCPGRARPADRHLATGSDADPNLGLTLTHASDRPEPVRDWRSAP
ncbi:hypothetical protein AB0K43_02705 [Kitasatospora sp. NPDC049258]